MKILRAASLWSNFTGSYKKECILDSVPDLEKKLPSDVFMTFIYIAGYVGRNDDEIHEMYFYYEFYGNYLKDMNRGELKIPGDIICN